MFVWGLSENTLKQQMTSNFQCAQPPKEGLQACHTLVFPDHEALARDPNHWPTLRFSCGPFNRKPAFFEESQLQPQLSEQAPKSLRLQLLVILSRKPPTPVPLPRHLPDAKFSSTSSEMEGESNSWRKEGKPRDKQGKAATGAFRIMSTTSRLPSLLFYSANG